jgi:HSP20 family protein
MTLVRRAPDRAPMRSAIERLLQDWPLASIDGGFTELAPPIDIRETDEAYVVEIDMPGVKPEDTEVLIEGRTLTIRGKFDEESERREGNYLLRERRHGQFMRAVALPGMVDVDKVTSKTDNGELVITLPKSSQSRARRIEITSGSDKSASANAGNGKKR